MGSGKSTEKHHHHHHHTAYVTPPEVIDALQKQT